MKKGDIVVCVDDYFPNRLSTLIYPIKGKIYTIRSLFETRSCYLEEIVNQKIRMVNIFTKQKAILEPMFGIFRFKKLDELADINELTKILERELI